jgi:predicted ATP-binding protein involved in virulence
MSLFEFKKIVLKNYRCFELLELSLETDLTVLFAENGGGKSALLNALAAGIALFQQRSPSWLKIDALRDTRKTTNDKSRQREAAGPCSVIWHAAIASGAPVDWSVAVNPASGRRKNDLGQINDAIESTRKPGERWPLFAWYGTDRIRGGKKPGRPSLAPPDRWDAYAGSLDPTLIDGPLLEWLEREVLGDVVRNRQKEPERGFDKGVTDAMVRATPGITEAWYDPVERSPVVRFEDGHVGPWYELSDGYHAFLALIGDIARRAVALNEMDGAKAPECAEGVVLIDEIDLHLHPRWQRVALHGLCKAFPKLQFVVTTHSPQVLSSAKNHQVRHLVNWKLQDYGLFVEGRDSNSILRELMHTDDRDDAGKEDLARLYDAIDTGRKDDAEAIFESLLTRWGQLDPELIRARGQMEETE